MSGLGLTRRTDESVFLQSTKTGELIEVKVVEIKGKQVRLSINAPKEFVIHRDKEFIDKL